VTIIVRPSGHRHRGRFYDNVPYVVGGTAEQVLDLYLPTSRFGGGALFAPPYPLVMFFHGGGWQTGNNNIGPTHVVRAMTAQGCAVASINYTHSGTTGCWPQYIYDLKAGIRFLRANAGKFLLDAKRFMTWGYSSGAHGSMMCALTANGSPRDGAMGNGSVSESLLGAIMWAAPVNFIERDADYVTLNAPPYSLGLTPAHTTCATDSPEAKLFWGSSNTTLTPCSGAGLTLSAEANGELLLAYGAPSLYWGHGELDATIPFLQSERAHAAAVSLGIDSTYTKYTGLTHGSITSDATSVADAQAWARTLLAA
jgi:acetyl esterase/lipase